MKKWAICLSPSRRSNKSCRRNGTCSVRLPDPVITAMYSAAHARLELLANRTGGRLHEIRRLDDLSKLYAQVAADLRTLYTVVYQPPNPSSHDGKWREIRVEVARADLIASTKPGYYAK